MKSCQILSNFYVLLRCVVTKCYSEFGLQKLLSSETQSSQHVIYIYTLMFFVFCTYPIVYFLRVFCFFLNQRQGHMVADSVNEVTTPFLIRVQNLQPSGKLLFWLFNRCKHLPMQNSHD